MEEVTAVEMEIVQGSKKMLRRRAAAEAWAVGRVTGRRDIAWKLTKEPDWRSPGKGFEAACIR
jgi:hypothetical protein